MARQNQLRLLCVAASLAGLAWFGQSSRGVEPDGVRIALQSNPEPAISTKETVTVDHSRYVGVAGCASANCHGGDGSRGVLGSEYSIWIQEDPHAKAYTDLFNETSQRMAAALRLDKPAHQAKLCLNCHGPQSDPPFDGPIAGHGTLLDGVSCESCHGAASRWLGPHVRRDWKQKSAAEKAEFGFRDTKDLWTRGKVCADCHVGEPGRDVNHDLYAAGHPRLFFELSAFDANLPAHWDRQAERKREAEKTGPFVFGGLRVTESSFEGKLWAVGQVASMEAALDLLIHRARNATDDVPAFARGGEYPSEKTIAVWPELAETGCFACHHDLKSPSWRQKRGFPGRKPGELPWQTWMSPMITEPVPANFYSGPLMQEMAKPFPQRMVVIEQATRERARLEKAGRSIADRASHPLMLRKVAQYGSEHGTESWDAATQTYLGLVASRLAIEDSRDRFTGLSDETMQRLDELLESIRVELAFPDGTESPRNFGGRVTQDLQSYFDQVHSLAEEIQVRGGGAHAGAAHPDR